MSTPLQTVQENSKNLRSIPIWMLETPSITRLSLRKNNISLIPTDIAQLSHLKRLDLSDNQLYSIPAEVGFLTCLEILQLANNHICTLPHTLGKCFNLQVLDIKANRITVLPHFFTKLVNLLRLDLSHNAISTPIVETSSALADGPLDSLWHLTSLASLTLDGNFIQQLPPIIAQLSSIERLSLVNCGLKSLPNHLCALVKMKQLFLSNNNFNRLPKLIGNMLLLQELDCDDTPIWDIPATLGRCTNLTRLRMTNCPLHWPLDNLVMQEPAKVIQFLMEREEAEIHAKPLGQVPSLPTRSLPEPEIYKVYDSSEGLSRFYANIQIKTHAEFRDRFDLMRQSSTFQTPEQRDTNLKAVQKELAARAVRDREDEARGYKIKPFHAGFSADRYLKPK